MTFAIALGSGHAEDALRLMTKQRAELTKAGKRAQGFSVGLVGNTGIYFKWMTSGLHMTYVPLLLTEHQ